MNINPWIALVTPFICGGLALLALNGCKRYSKWRAERARRIRNDKLAQYGMQGVRGTKDRFLS